MTTSTLDKVYSQWLQEEQKYLKSFRKALETPISDAELSSLVQSCYRHYTKFVDAKIQAAQQDISYVAAGMWRTPLEAGFLWMGGWRPTTAILLAFSLMGIQIENELGKLLAGIEVPSMAALSARQLSRLNNLQQQTRGGEDDLTNRLAVLQMLVADQQMARATTAEPPPSESNDLSEVREAMEPKLAGLRDLLVEAEQLRLQTLRELTSVLMPVQAAQYTIAAFEMAIAVRKLGEQASEADFGEAHSSSSEKGGPNIRDIASQGEVGQLREVLQTGTDPSESDYDGRTPLHVAASKGHTECVALLVKEGAKVNEIDNFGMTPLLEALKRGHDAAAQILVDNGAQTLLKEAGTEMCKAVASGDMEYVDRLVKHGVDPNAVDYSQRTPLHVAAGDGTAKNVEMLVHGGADVLVRDRHGCTPLDEARKSDNKATLKILEAEVLRRQHELDSELFGEYQYGFSKDRSIGTSMEGLQEADRDAQRNEVGAGSIT